jgi:hypothetical protein
MSLDHLVGAGEERGRHVEAERFGGFEINDEFNFCPHAGTYIEASTTKKPTIKQTTALVTSEAHGQPSAQDSSHRVCM